MKSLTSRAFITALALLGASGLALAHSAGEHAQHSEPAKQETSEVSFADVQLINQRGQMVNLQQDLVHDRIVVMSFIYTTCTTVCPVVSSIMSKVQKKLGARVGSDVQLVSITVDPQRDNPQRLLSYSARFQNGPGWSWLTGSQQAISDTLKGLGTWTADFENHPPLIMIGDGRSQYWTRFYGFTDPAVLVDRVERLTAARTPKAGHHDVFVQEDRP